MIPVSVLLLVIGAVLIATTPVSNQATPEELQQIATGSSCIGYGVWFLITSVLSIIICPIKHKEIANGSMEIAPRVFLIVFGAIAENIFYVLAGIFGLVARSQELNSNSSNTSSEE